MRKVLASNSNYEIAVDAARNRIYVAVHGSSSSVAVAPRYLDDIEVALEGLKRELKMRADQFSGQAGMNETVSEGVIEVASCRNKRRRAFDVV
ncbi:hypothetical protein [Paraburkholderia domus]|uniref:hypothetical protein n=1 Tax=Paraburkholderia domus TaxID=2793075 RepID=UPI001B2BDA85|nr:hypothetical protein [Paraburkholderia domus]CAE6841555.1 hypothetical protein R75483_07177 [Paraburkholderia domus]